MPDNNFKERRDITGKNTIADALRPVLQEVSQIDPRQYKIYFEQYRAKCIERTLDDSVSASDKQRKRWVNSFEKSKNMTELLFTLSNLELGASNNRLDRGTGKKSNQFGHWE